MVTYIAQWPCLVLHYLVAMVIMKIKVRLGPFLLVLQVSVVTLYSGEGM